MEKKIHFLVNDQDWASDQRICNDSGLGKVANALNVPTVTIWGPSDWPRCHSWSENSIDIRKELSCSPCCQLDGTETVENCRYGYKCLDSISVDEVFEAIATKLKGH